MESTAVRIPVPSVETSEPSPELKIHVEEPETTEQSFGVILGDTEIINYPGCVQYRAQAIQTLNGQPFNIVDTVMVTVAKGEQCKQRGTRFYAKAFINREDVPNQSTFIEGECDIESEVQNHMEHIRKNMERAMSPLT